VVSAADPRLSLISDFLTGAATFLSSSFSFILTRAEWTPFQTHGYSEKLQYFKVIVKLSLCLTKHYAMKTYGGSGCIGPRFLYR
jgi:hypothetical protein